MACYSCDKKGHMAADFPKQKGGSRGGGNGAAKSESGANARSEQRVAQVRSTQHDDVMAAVRAVQNFMQEAIAKAVTSAPQGSLEDTEVGDGEDAEEALLSAPKQQPQLGGSATRPRRG
jgi:hypothetical protein